MALPINLRWTVEDQIPDRPAHLGLQRRITHALEVNGLTWESPYVDLVDALIYDADIGALAADEIVTRNLR